MEERFFQRVGVELRHRPTGVRIRCSEQSCQALNRFLARRNLADELEARLQNKTRHEVKAERIKELKGKLKRPSVRERIGQYTLRPFAQVDRQSASRKVGELLGQFKRFGDEQPR